MKKIFTLLASMALLTGANAKTVPVSVIGKPSRAEAVTLAGKMRSLPSLVKKAKSAETGVNAEFILDKEKQQYVFTLIAVESQSVEEGYYEPDQLSETSFSFVLPEGTYDFMAIIDDDEAAERIILIKEDVEIGASAVDLKFDPATASYTTRISHVDSQGNKLTLPSYTDPSNCTTGDFIDLVTHNGVLVWAGETLAYMECNYILTTDRPDSRFSMVRSDIIGAENEVVSYLIPVDYSKEICGPVSSAGWQVSDQSYASTPITDAYDQYYIDKLGHPSYFTFVCRGIIIGEEWWGTTGLGVFDMPCNSQRIAMWAPEDYDGPFDIAISPSADVFSGDDSSVQGLPLVRSGEGLIQIGLNFATGSKNTTFMATSVDKSIKNQNPRFAVVPSPGMRANCTPLFFACTDYSGFFYTYKGRYGEDMSFDAYDILSSMDNETLMEKLGGQPSDVVIYSDGKLICSSRHELSNRPAWVPGAENKAVVTMDNVLIDGEISGCNTATVCWNDSKGNGFAPTFTSLQFRNSHDEVSDRFANATDGVLEFTVGDLAFEYSEEGGFFYYDVAPVTDVKAEYAPHGSTEFMPIEVTEDPALFFAPGYGSFYRGSLSCVDRKAYGGWFDLRLTATDADGAYVEQVISPAFQIKSLSGVGEIKGDSEISWRIEAGDIIVSDDVSIYTVDGRLCSGDNVLPGVYILKHGSASRKIVVR